MVNQKIPSVGVVWGIMDYGILIPLLTALATSHRTTALISIPTVTPVDSLFDRLRRWIHSYVILEGLSIALVWLGLTFWLGLALDYLPVLLGASEMPRGARATLLIVIGIVAAVIVYQWIYRRVRAQWKDKSLAVLVERHYPDFHDRLVTSVELRGSRDSLSPVGQQLLDVLELEIGQQVEDVDLRRLFNPSPLARAGALAAVVVLSILFFGLFSGTALATWASRLYGLSDRTWPRRAAIEVVGFGESRLRKIARGSNFVVRVRADANRPTPPPELCTIYYHTADGEQGRVNMSQQGAPREGHQYYSFDDKPFKTLLSDVHFDVVGFDHRVRDYHLQVVQSPVVQSLQLHCELPRYTELLPRDESYRDGLRLPKGTHVKIKAVSNNPLSEATITDLNTEQSFTLKPAGADDSSDATFEYELDRLSNNVRHEIQLIDKDGVASQQPFVLLIQAVEDEAPKVDLRLRGIGSAITPAATIPVEGKIKDDYGIQSAWYELESDGVILAEIPLAVAGTGDVNDALDLKNQQASNPNLRLQVDTRVTLRIAATDKYDLADERNEGQSDRYELDVVTPSQLLALLEARELGLRQRLEQIIREMRETQDSLSRVLPLERDTDAETASNVTPPPSADTVADDNGAADFEDDLAETDDDKRAGALLRLRVQRAQQHSQRATNEVMGVALSFDDIRDELVNNRVDSQDRRWRIEESISAPLKAIAIDQFPQFDTALAQLEGQLDAIDFMPAQRRALATVSSIIFEMENVLTKMLDLEKFDELIDELRSLIQEQETIMEETKKQRKQQALDLLK